MTHGHNNSWAQWKVGTKVYGHEDMYLYLWPYMLKILRQLVTGEGQGKFPKHSLQN